MIDQLHAIQLYEQVLVIDRNPKALQLWKNLPIEYKIKLAMTYLKSQRMQVL